MSVVNNLNDTMKKRDPVDRGAIRVEEIVPRTDLVKHTSTTSSMTTRTRITPGFVSFAAKPPTTGAWAISLVPITSPPQT